MKERPILFSGPMVRAILGGRKTQTRRVVKPQPNGEIDNLGDGQTLISLSSNKTWICPYGQPGDRLWVRETWWHDGISSKEPSSVCYRDSGEMPGYMRLAGDTWRPSIHMPRWASRITLEITQVRVERLTDITEEDACAEGIEPPRCTKCGYTKWDAQFHMDHNLCGKPNPESAVPVFAGLWDSINCKLGFGWDTNPWVWVIEFGRI